IDVVLEIGEAILAARRAEVRDVDIEPGRADVACERAPRQQVEDEIAAHGGRYEQHRRTAARLAGLVEQAQQPELVLAVDDRRRRRARAVVAGRREDLVEAFELLAAASR